MNYRIEQYHTYLTSTRTGVSPRRVCRWRIVREQDGRVIETSIRTRKLAEWSLRGMN